MTDLETRIRDLRVEVEVPEGLSPAELRQHAAARGRRRVRSLAAVTVLLMVGAATVVVTVLDDDPDVDQVTTGPDPSTGGAETPNITFGDVTGVVVNVSPREDLIDGQEVEVSIDGLENLPYARLVQCAGDTTAADTVASCDVDAVHDVGAGATQAAAEPHQTVSVSRTIHITRGSDEPNTPRPYDCATEPAGCVLIVAPLDMPPQGVAVPLTFRNVPMPEQEVAVIVEPSSGLQDGEDVQVVAEGLRPNRVFWMTVCEVEQSDEPAGPYRHCDWWPVEEASNEEGTLTATVTVRSAIYDPAGRKDCTAVSCAVVVFESGGMAPAGAAVGEVPVSFADDVVAPVPVLELDPPGPYEDRQRITVRGRGFPPGVTLAGEEGLDQCVPGKETSMPGLCSARDMDVDVGADGTFTRTVWVDSSLGFPDSCAVDCVLGWRLDKGPLLVSVPLDFE